MRCHVHESSPTSLHREVFVTVTPEAGDTDVRQILTVAAGILHETGARLLRRRIFIPHGKLEACQSALRESFAGAGPHARAALHAGGNGHAGGVQLHGLISSAELLPLIADDLSLQGVTFTANDTRYALTSGLSDSSRPDPADEAGHCFSRTESLLSQAGMGLSNIARTWIYIDDILSCYSRFNAVRNALFIERGLLQRGQSASDVRVPASTGMGVKPASPGRVSLESFALAGPHAQLTKLAASGSQKSAFEYGSAFARAAECRTPAGHTLFVSGTADIDKAGATCNLDNAPAQTRATLHNILAVLNSSNYSPSHVVEAIAYCKSPDIARNFISTWQSEIPWPWIVVIGDVCRDNLLFEAEVTAFKPDV
jgi:enamine deaminase RidA (YjgF/YER057c/UK114 family)